MKTLPSRTIGRIRKLWRQGFRIWRIAEDLNLTEWQVAKQLKRDGVPWVKIIEKYQLRNGV